MLRFPLDVRCVSVPDTLALFFSNQSTFRSEGDQLGFKQVHQGPLIVDRIGIIPWIIAFQLGFGM